MRWRTGSQTNCCRWRIWLHTGRFDLNPARNTREKLLLPLGDIKPLQQARRVSGCDESGWTLDLQ
ncbi:hypothetical protein ACLBR5_10840 [Escherichia coli]